MQHYPVFDRPRRPPLVEVAGAILVVGGVAQLLLRIAAIGQGAALPPIVVAVGFGLDTLAIVVGLLIRAGTAWIVCMNVVAILAFIDFRELVLAGSPVAGFFLALDTLAVVAVVRHRPWFERERAPASSGRRTARSVQGWTADEVAETEAPGDPRTGRG